LIFVVVAVAVVVVIAVVVVADEFATPPSVLSSLHCKAAFPYLPS